MKKWFCDICSAEMPAFTPGSSISKRDIEPIVVAVLDLMQAEDVCEGCLTATVAINPASVLREAILGKKDAIKREPAPEQPKSEKPSAEVEGLGELDDAKLRRRTQAALTNYITKHGDNIRPLIRATGNRITENTLRSMASDLRGFSAKHWQAVDVALKKLALADIQQPGANVG